MEAETNNTKPKNTIEAILFSSKWLLIPFYFGLMVALFIFTFVDIKEILHLFQKVNGINEEDAMMMILKLIDLTMIANLVKLIIVGSYTSFFKKHVDDKEENDTKKGSDPNLNTSSGVLKVKMATSLIGVTSINLLQTFISPESVDPASFQKQLIIHSMFLLGALILAVIDWFHVKAEAIHHEDCAKHNHTKH